MRNTIALLNMRQLKFSAFFFKLSLIISLLITGCSSIPDAPIIETIQQDSLQRAAKLAQLDHWKITGKIAFIQKNERNRVNINWQYDEVEQSQQLNLSTYLGINVLKLNSHHGQHKIKVDGKEYIGTDLDRLIYQLTGLTLPTKALTFWLKGLPYRADDSIHFDNNQLPASLTSSFLGPNGYRNSNWHITYGNYKTVSNYTLAKKITIKHGDLLIKIAIDDWQI